MRSKSLWRRARLQCKPPDQKLKLRRNNLRARQWCQIVRSVRLLICFRTKMNTMIWKYTKKSKLIPFELYRSTKIKCPFCDAVSLSIVEYKPSLIGYLVTILAMLLFGILSLILLPFLVSLTKSALHRCAKCLNEVKSNSYFGFSSMEDKLVSWQIGKFGIILTRKTLLYLVIVLTACLAIYVFVLVEEQRDH